MQDGTGVHAVARRANYTCQRCDFDLCEACYQAGGDEADVPPHAPDHELVRLPIAPIPPAAGASDASGAVPAGASADADLAPSTVADSEGEDDMMLAMAVAILQGDAWKSWAENHIKLLEQHTEQRSREYAALEAELAAREAKNEELEKQIGLDPLF